MQFTATAMEVGESAQTEIQCEPEIEREDRWLASFMQTSPEWRLEGEQLQLTSEAATIELEETSDATG